MAGTFEGHPGSDLATPTTTGARGPGSCYRVMPFDSRYLRDILRIECALWSPDTKINAAYFDWKYLQNPYLADPHLYLVLHADEVVGVRGFHGSAWRVGPDPAVVVSPAGGDTVVAPLHQGRGLFAKLNRYAVDHLTQEGFRFLCNFSAARVTYLRSIRSGWRSVGPYDLLVRDRVAGRPSGRDVPDSKVSVSDRPRPDAMAALARECDSPNLIRLHRDRAFFDWRYRSPLSRYCFLYTGGERLDGFMILQKRLFLEKPGMRIVDWQCRDPRTFSLLLEAAIARIDTERLSIWSATLPRDICVRLKRAGFQPAGNAAGAGGQYPGPLVLMLGGAADQPHWRLGESSLTELPAWELRMICSDGC
ncbi:MAG: hypothetical protein WB783_02730 [Arenicellales bacterium]